MNPKIKIIKEVKKPAIVIHKEIPIDQNRQLYFSTQLDNTSINIQNNGNKYNLYPYVGENQSLISQFWCFEFEGQKNFKGKQIGGILKFQPDHPLRPPKFFFQPVVSNGQVDRVIQHENIYGDHSLCIPMLNEEVWNPNTSPYDILQAIEHIFANPNWVNNTGAPANPMFASKPQEEKDIIQQQQAKFLPNFEDGGE